MSDLNGYELPIKLCMRRKSSVSSCVQGWRGMLGTWVVVY